VKILKYPNPFLSTPTVDIDLNELADTDYPTLIMSMKYELTLKPKAVAIAANQVGVNGRFFVLNKDFAEAHKLPQVIVNPKYTQHNPIEVVDNEGCLSFPGVNIPVPNTIHDDSSPSL